MKKVKEFLCGLFGHCFREPSTSDYNSKTHEITVSQICSRCGKKLSFTAHESKFGLWN